MPESFTLNIYTNIRKSKFVSESKLFDALKCAVSGVSPYVVCHLTTYPFIAVHIQHGEPKLLDLNKGRFESIVWDTLNDYRKS